MMGVDVLRHPGHNSGDPRLEDIQTRIETLASHGVKTSLMMDPPNHLQRDRALSNEERMKRLKKLTPRLEKIAKALRGQVYAYEIGNEPDLTFFYPGPIDWYVDSFAHMSDAIHRGDPDAIVMNGGLSFHGSEGEPRSHEMVRLIDATKLDAWAYHGHGPGVEAERHALQRMRRSVASAGQPRDKPFVETESGFAAVTDSQELEQARTAVQKMVYAWSEGSPTLMWFRLYMPESARWSNLRGKSQPRPVVFAYRNMVEQLRHHRFERAVNLGSSNVEGYLFRDTQSSRRVLVFWSNTSYAIDTQLNLDQNKAAQIIDLYGNRRPADIQTGGNIPITITETPAFLVWDSLAEESSVGIGRPLIETIQSIRVVPGSVATMKVVVRNPLNTTAQATIAASYVNGAQSTASNHRPDAISVLSDPRSIQLGPGESAEVEVKVQSAPEMRLMWPTVWTVFPSVPNTVDLSQFKSIPEAMAGVRPQTMYAKSHTIDLAELGGIVQEKERAVMMAIIDSPRKQTVTIGAAADWWMSWHLNGEAVYDTLKAGNGGPMRVDSHTFDITLNEGENVVAIEVLAGLGGWQLLTASPDTLERTLRGDQAVDAIELTFALGDDEPVTRRVPVEWSRSVPRWDSDEWSQSIELLSRIAPAAVLGEDAVVNRFTKLPDAAMWWAGPQDLSSVVWLGSDQNHLYVVVRVTDDVDEPGESGAADTIELGLASNDGQPIEFVVGRADGGVFVRPARQIRGQTEKIAGVDAKIERAGKDTVYRVRFPLNSFDSGLSLQYRICLTVQDQDDNPDSHKQYAAWPVESDISYPNKRGWVTIQLQKN